MRMMIVAALGLGLCFAPASAEAQQRSEQGMALAREIIALSKSVETSDAMMDAIRPVLVSQYRHQGMNERDANRLVEIFFEEMASEHEAIIELSAIAYVDRFTDQQLREVRDFLATPTGRAWSDASIDLTAALAQAGMVFGEQAGMRAVQRLSEERAGARGPS